MRPTSLNPLFAPVSALPGVGEKTARLYRHLLGSDAEPRVLDLLFHLPAGTIDRRARPKLIEVVPDTVATVEVTVETHAPPRRPQGPYLVYASDDTTTLTIVYFSARKDYIDKILPVGARRTVSGKITVYDGTLQM